MQGKNNLFALLFASIFMWSACGGKKNEVALADITPTYHRFFEELAVSDSSHLVEHTQQLVQKYPYFFRLYTEGVLKLGEVPDSIFPDNLYQFLQNPIYLEVLDTVRLHFASTADIEQPATQALARLKTLFPNHETPEVFWTITVFNEAIVVGDNLVAVSLEHYLGNGHYFYDQLGTYKYLQAYKVKKRIPLDILDGWNRTEFLMDATRERLLDDMVYEGRLLYLLSVLFPDVSVEELLGYTPMQAAWIKANEAAVWTYLVEQQQLFSTEMGLKRTYIREAPYTSVFGNSSPSRLGRYIGYKIVEGYMKHAKGATIPALFRQENAQVILQGSQYNP